MSAAKTPRTQLRVGRLVKAHGLKGALKVELYTDDPDGRFVPGAVFTLQVPESSPWHGQTVTVREFKWLNSNPVVFLEGIEDRTGAESIVRAILWVDQDDQTAPVEDDAWYDHQLVGLEVVRDDVVVGRVVRVDHLPAQDLLIVKPTGADSEILVPFVTAIVPEVDIAAGRVIVTPPAGLFEELPPEAETPDAEAQPAAETPDAEAQSEAEAPDAEAQPAAAPEATGPDAPDAPAADDASASA